MAVFAHTLKLLVKLTTRPQTNVNEVAGWFAPLAPWTAAKVIQLIGSSPTPTVLLSSEYELRVLDEEFADNGKHAWEAYPRRRITVDVDDSAVFRTHLDAYYTDLMAELEAILTSNAVTHRATATWWHQH